MNQKEDGKYLYIKNQYKGTRMTWGKDGHKSEDCFHKEGENVPKCNYYSRLVHLNKDCHKIIKNEG